MTRLVWSTPARDDLREIRGTTSPPTRRATPPSVTGRLVTTVRHLRGYPLAGRIVPELGRSTIREIIRGNYRIVNRVTADRVEILAVVHGARDFPTSSFLVAAS